MEHEQRKLQALGGSLYLSLPASWGKRFHLDKGSSVDLTITDSGELRVFPGSKKIEERTATLRYDRYFFRNMMREYLYGSDVIAVIKKTPFTHAERREVAEVVANLLNLEIIEEDSQKIVIQHLKSDIPLKNLVTRMYHLTKTMMDDLCKAKRDVELLKNIIERDVLVGKCYLAVIMQIRAALTTQWNRDWNLVQLLDMRLFVERIEKIGDLLKQIAQEGIHGKNIPVNDLLALSSLYEQAYKGYMNTTLSVAEQFWDKDRESQKRFSQDRNVAGIYEYIKDITDLII